MTAVWLEPVAWWGMLALAAPIVIHLLARRQSRTLAFPSLRFLQATRLAAIRRRALSDVLLLFVRLLVIATAVAAMAAPMFITPARRTMWERRTARAVVELWPEGARSAEQPAPTRETIEAERSSAFVSRTDLATGRAADAIEAAVDWLHQQSPAARELVIAGDIRAGLLTDADVAAVPSAIGIRFLPLAEGVPPRSFASSVISGSTSEAGAPVLRSVTVTAEDGATRVVYRDAPRRAADVLSIVASASDAAFVAAMAEAILAEGLVLPTPADRRVIIELPGAPVRPVTTPAAAAWMREVLETVPDGGGERDGALVARVALSPSDPRAVGEAARIARAALTPPLDDREPRRVSAATLAAWSRPPGGVPQSAPIGNEGDARWVWLAVLSLLAIEHVIRRFRVRRHAEPADVEARVA
jgi:hypothetical protein